LTANGEVGPEPEPPIPAAYVIVCELIVHFAYKVVSVVKVTDCPFV